MILKDKINKPYNILNNLTKREENCRLESYILQYIYVNNHKCFVNTLYDITI